MIVMKFGGTSIGDAAGMRNAVSIVTSRSRERKVIVVLSACAGVTDALMRCARLAAEDREAEALKYFETHIVARHYGIVQNLIEDLSWQDAAIRQLRNFFEELRNLLRGISITGDLSLRVLDFFMSYGERISTYLMGIVMQEMKLGAELGDARKCIITNENFGNADPLFDETATRCREYLLPMLDRNDIVILQGFIGSTARGIVTTLGRGGSDYTAAVVGAVLQAEDIEIWTDVDGIMTADPKLVPDARRIKVLSFQEASELAYFGAKVLHPSTLIPAIEKDVPVHIYNSHRPSAPGTMLTGSIEPTGGLVKSISYKTGITVVNISSTRMLGSYGFMKKIFDVFDSYQTSVDLVTTSEVSVSLSIEHSADLEGLVEELKQVARVRVETDRAILCIVGEGLRSSSGLAARIFGCLRDINILMISQGSSDLSVTCVVEESSIPTAVAALHREFFHDVNRPDIFE